MPTIDFTQVFVLPITELAFPEPIARTDQDEGPDLFSDYLHRANDVPSSPGAEDRQASDSNRQPATNMEQGRSSDEKLKSVSPEKTAQEKESDSQAEKDLSTTSDISADSANAQREEGKESEEVAARGSNAEDVKPAAEEPVSEKDEKKDEAIEAESAAEAITAMQADAGKIAENFVSLPATKAGDKAELGNAAKEAIASLESLAEQTGGTPADIKETPDLNGTAQFTEKKLAGTEEMSATANPTDEILEISGKGKAKTKKIRETAGAKSVERKETNDRDNRRDAATQSDAGFSAATSNKVADDGGRTPSAVAQASASVVQTMVDMLQNAEKPALAATENSVGPTGEVRIGSSGKIGAETAAEKSGSAGTAAESDNGAGVRRAQFVQRVERAFAAMGQRDGSVRLKLSPPDLGVLKLEIGVQKGVMKARIEAETPAAQSLLLDNLPELRERLAQQNIHIQQFDVDLMDRSPGGMPQHTSGQADSDSRQGNRHAPSAKAAAKEAAVGAAASAGMAQQPGMGGRLNVFV